MTSRGIPVVPFVLVVFGATGDLARRKLLPAMFHRDIAGQLPGEAKIIGTARGNLTHDAFIALAREAIIDHVAAEDRAEADVERFIARLDYVPVEADDDHGWPELTKALEPFSGRVNVFYLATGPALFGPICERLGRFGLAHGNARVVVEKPLGMDLE